uniref:C2H2-type domain-containing protein n=1 Tax=Dendroctonus ponderosae TaxID=77166 RepID=A0AAR5PPM9_DENPD
MDGDSQITVYPVLDKEEQLDSFMGEVSDNDIIYLKIEEQDEENPQSNPEPESSDTLSYVVQANSVLDASRVLNSGIKIVTLGDEQYFYIPPSSDKSGESSEVEPQFIATQAIEVDEESTVAHIEATSITEGIEEISELSEAEDGILKLEPYEMIMLDDVEGCKPVEAPKKFKCLYKGCENFYSTSKLLTVHLRNHINNKSFQCSYEGCGKKFATNYSLTTHWRTHTGEKPYACRVCLKSFKTSGDLLKHIRTHTGEKPFACPVEDCGKSFTTSNIRKVHVRSHTGERPYVCDYPNCGKAFASSTNYKNHARIHSGEKPFACHVKGCDKKFTEYSSLYKHQAVHQTNGEKNHECSYCKQKFKSERTLHVHQKVKHGILVSPDGIQFLDLELVGLEWPH